ncbi:MAG: MBL fold metallo-hydrolase [Clostridia bacterium]
MFKFCSLFSGSTGNSLLVETENSKVLIDAGESTKKIVDALSLVNVDISDIDGILVTHEHTDHIKSLGTISKKYNIPVYANAETWKAMPEQEEKILSDNKKTFLVNEKFEIKDLSFKPFSIPHDATNPCGFNVFNKDKKISIATDLGHITPEILNNLEKSSFALLEANCDPNILRYSRYPYSLKQRISGPNGHLSNNNSGEIVSMLMKTGLTRVMLGHLSKENNFPELAYKTVVEEIINNHYDESDIKVKVAKRDGPSDVIDIA